MRGLLSRAQIAAGIITGRDFFSHDSIGVAELLISSCVVSSAGYRYTSI